MEATIGYSSFGQGRWRVVNARLGCKAEGKSTDITPYDCCYVYTSAHKCGRLLLSRKMVPAWYRLMARCAGIEKTG